MIHESSRNALIEKPAIAIIHGIADAILIGVSNALCFIACRTDKRRDDV
jgi:hypothetical protein